MIDKNLIGKKIQYCRNRKNMTQEELSEAVEISSNYLSKVERCLSIPSADILLKIIEVLDIQLKDFEIYKQPEINEDKIKIEKILNDCNKETLKLIYPILYVLVETLKKINILYKLIFI